MVLPEIMTAKDVARYLQINVRTVYNMANKGELPGVKIGCCWRFKRELILNWAIEKSTHNGYHDNEITKEEGVSYA